MAGEASKDVAVMVLQYKYDDDGFTEIPSRVLANARSSTDLSVTADMVADIDAYGNRRNNLCCLSAWGDGNSVIAVVYLDVAKTHVGMKFVAGAKCG